MEQTVRVAVHSGVIERLPSEEAGRWGLVSSRYIFSRPLLTCYYELQSVG